MAKLGYLVSEETVERISKTLRALNHLHTLMAMADDKSNNEFADLLDIVHSYADFDLSQAQYGRWLEQEAPHVQKSV